jgi:hypothetical protein
MGKRSANAFRRNDGLRALRVARDGGLEPSAMEILVGKDGDVCFRVYGEKAAGLMGVAPTDAAGAKEWQDEILRLKTAKPKTKGR